MTEILGHDDVDRRLARIGARMDRAGYDPSRTLRRLQWEERLPLLRLLFVAVLVAGALAFAQWIVAAGTLLPLVRSFEKWQGSKGRREALLANDDFLERERKHLESRLFGVRSIALVEVALALLLAYLASRGMQHATAQWTLAGILLAYALFQILVTAPSLGRELRELGGEDGYGWFSAVMVAAIFVALPILAVVAFVRFVVRRIRGLPGEDES